MLRKPDQDRGNGPDEQQTLDEKLLKIEPGRWYSLIVQTSGPDVLVLIDGRPALFGSTEAYQTPKTTLQLTAGGGDAVTYRNVQVWEAKSNAEWPKIREQTLAKRRD
jgi:hypothetical protein